MTERHREREEREVKGSKERRRKDKGEAKTNWKKGLQLHLVDIWRFIGAPPSHRRWTQ